MVTSADLFHPPGPQLTASEKELRSGCIDQSQPKVSVGGSHHGRMAQQRSSSSQGDVAAVDGGFQDKDNKGYLIKLLFYVTADSSIMTSGET